MLEQRHEEALAIADDVAAAALETDLYAGLGWRLVRARAWVGSGRPAEAVEVARTAVELVDPTDYLLGRGQARLALALALVAVGRRDEAALVAQAAERLLEEKGATLLSERARLQVADARGGEPGNRAPLERC